MRNTTKSVTHFRLTMNDYDAIIKRINLPQHRGVLSELARIEVLSPSTIRKYVSERKKSVLLALNRLMDSRDAELAQNGFVKKNRRGMVHAGDRRSSGTRKAAAAGRLAR